MNSASLDHGCLRVSPYIAQGIKSSKWHVVSGLLIGARIVNPLADGISLGSLPEIDRNF